MAGSSSRAGGRRADRRTPPASPFALPFALAAGLALFALAPGAQASPALPASFAGAAAFLLLWLGLQWLGARRGGRPPGFVVALRPQHYVQAMAQLGVYLYWGHHWRPVYDHLWLIAGQILFAYAFDMLLCWSRRRDYALGFGPVPIILSINLFLWFRDDWFHMQFLMVALGFMGKEYVRWRRDGRNAHIFNPSAFALGLFSLILIATGTTGLTWGPEIASTLTLAPNIYAFLFLTGLVVMYFFSVTLVAGMAALTLFALSALYAAAAGVPYFVDSEIPAAVFLGLHLLVTDPSTSPRSQAGKAVFGVLYGLGVFVLYAALERFGAPTFYDKLLIVPLLNLGVVAIDRAARALRPPDGGRAGGRSNLAHMAVWALAFGAMTALGRTDGRHPGDSLPFWQRACAEGRANACERLRRIELAYCADNSAWACNELGLHWRGREEGAADTARAYFARACELKYRAGCLNLLDDDAAARTPPRELDLRLLLREGGRNLMAMPAAELYARACGHGWAFACDGDRP